MAKSIRKGEPWPDWSTLTVSPIEVAGPGPRIKALGKLPVPVNGQ